MDMEKPKWFECDRLIQDVCGDFLDRLGKGSLVSGKKLNQIRITDKKFPYMFVLDGDFDPEDSWKSLLELDGELLCINRVKNNYINPWDNAGVKLLPQGEELIRKWMGRPIESAVEKYWRELVQASKEFFPGDIILLANSLPLSYESDMFRVIEGYKQVGGMLTGEFYQTQISANCFFRDSKFLEGKEGLLQTLYPSYEKMVVQRKIVLNVSLPKKVEAVLFIENLDVFNYLVQSTKGRDVVRNTVLIFSSGFKACARRGRTQGAISFSYVNVITKEQKDQFENEWYNDGWADLSLCFWGDLDFSGLSILRSLRALFPELTAWKPGYSPMLSVIEQGHLPQHSKKQNQTILRSTGCKYTDEVLLPAILKYGKFVDQEMVVTF